MIYTVVVSGAAFGPSGFGSVRIVDQHNSPQKIPLFVPQLCGGCVTNIAVATAHSGPNVATAKSQFTVAAGLDQPSLSIQRRDGTVTICWPVTTCGTYVLEQTGVLSQPGVWSPVNAAITIVDGNNCVTLPSYQQQQFFRLRSL